MEFANLRILVAPRKSKLIYFLAGLILLASCSQAPTIEQTTAPTDTASAAATGPSQPSTTPTGQATANGKLLNPCALMPADEVENLFGSKITGDYRLSIIVPTTAASYATNGTLVEMERALYECQYTIDFFEPTYHFQRISISVEVFENADDAMAQINAAHSYYGGALQAQGLNDMEETSGLGDRAYSFVPNSVDEVPAFDFSALYQYFPIIHFVSGNYLVTIIVDPFSPSAMENQAYYEKALEFARNALASLPSDIHAAMPDQDYHLVEAWQPAGKPTEPCELVTPEEAQNYLDKPIIYETSNAGWGLSFGGIGDPEGLQQRISLSCSYITSKTIGFSQGRSTFDGISFVLSPVSDKEKEIYGDQWKGRLIENAGIGEAAFRGGGLYDDITLFQGNVMISVEVATNDDASTQYQAASEIAKLILSRYVQ